MSKTYFTKISYVVAGFLLVVFTGVSPLHATSMNMNITAEIIAPVTVTVNQPMNFGKIIASPHNASTLTIDPATGYATSANGAKAASGGPPATAGRFSVQGGAGSQIQLFIPVDGATLSAGNETMDVNNIKILCDENQLIDENEPNAHIPQSGNALSCNVGGDLNIKANQSAGLYSGTLTVTIGYQ